MRALIAPIPDGTYTGEAYVDSDGVVNEPLTVRLKVTKSGTDLVFDLSGSSPPCKGPMNSVIATTRSSVWLAVKHVFPEVPINAGMFEPLRIVDPEGTFLYARYPRPVSGCAAEVSQRVAEAVFAALVKAVPERVTAAPAGTSGNFVLGGWDPERGRNYVMYHITGGGYGGNVDHDGLSYGCSTIGISKSPPIEVLEQQFPLLFNEYALAEGSGGAGRHRGGFGLRYSLTLTGGEAKASFVMDHARFGPQGVLGGEDGGPAASASLSVTAASTSRRTSRRTRASRSWPATPSRSRPPAAAATATRTSATRPSSPATSSAATTRRRISGSASPPGCRRRA